MKTVLARPFHSWLILSVLIVTAPVGADQTISGKLTVTGELDVLSGSLSMGTSSYFDELNNETSAQGLTIHHSEDPQTWVNQSFVPGRSTVIYQVGQELADFYWRASSPDGLGGFTALDLMKLSSEQLLLQPSLSGLGTENTLPNQTLSAGNASIMTLGLADSRYLSQSGGSISGNLVVTGSTTLSSLNVGGGADITVNGYKVLTVEDKAHFVQHIDGSYVGEASYATPWTSAVAIGHYSRAGESAVAIGAHAGMWGPASSGSKSVAIGYVARAPGAGAVALGYGTWAAGTNSFSVSLDAASRSTGAMAIGMGTEASRPYQTVVGAYNDPDYVTEMINPGDHLFVVGNGTATDARSNALIVRRNGNMEVKGTSLTVNGIEVLTQTAAALVFQTKPEGEATFVTSEDLVTLQADIGNHYLSSDPLVGLAYGTGTEAIPHALAFGQDSKATGLASSSAIGNGAIANQEGSHALGNHVVANLPGQIVVGSYNEHGETEAGSSVANEDDPVFVIGAGTSSGNRKNALVVKRNGDTEVTGVLRVEPAGNLSMGTFMAGQRPVPPPAE